MKLSEVEYKILRQEMQCLTERKWKLDVTLFSFCGLLFAYLLSQEHADPLGFLIPIPIILLFLYIRHDASKHIWNGAAFCIVYGKDNDFLWEYRLYISRDTQHILKELSSKKGVEYEPFEIIAIILSCICVILYAYKNDSIRSIIVAFVIIILVVIILYFRRVWGIRHYAEIFDEEIKKWEAVKAKEKGEMNTLNLK